MALLQLSRIVMKKCFPMGTAAAAVPAFFGRKIGTTSAVDRNENHDSDPDMQRNQFPRNKVVLRGDISHRFESNYGVHLVLKMRHKVYRDDASFIRSTHYKVDFFNTNSTDHALAIPETIVGRNVTICANIFTTRVRRYELRLKGYFIEQHD